MSERQVFLDKVRDLKKDLEAELVKPNHFTKEVERFCVKEAIANLGYAEKHIQGYLQVDKYNGN
jgi:hypothetical protein